MVLSDLGELGEERQGEGGELEERESLQGECVKDKGGSEGSEDGSHEFRTPGGGYRVV